MELVRRAFLVAAAIAAFALTAPTAAHAQVRPMIEHIEPTSGPPGTRVTIVGRGFRPTARVLFNEHEVTVSERLPERITVEVPQGAASGRFVVAHGNDEVESEVFQVTAPEPPPTVSGIEPASAGPGMEVVIRGQNFGPRPVENMVRVGSVPMVVRSADPTMLRVIVPDGASTGNVTVRTRGGEVQGPVLTVGTRVTVRDFAPAAVAPGGHVVLHGAGFSTNAAQPNRVTLGGRPLRVLRATATEIEVEIPVDMTGGGSLVVETPGAGRFETGAALRVGAGPVVTAVDPPQGAPGARITLRGAHFGADARAVQVTLGSTAATVVTVAPDAIVVQVPTGAATGRWNVTVGGIGPIQAPADFPVLQNVNVAGFSPAAGDPGDRVTITGAGFSTDAAQDTVRLGNDAARVISATATQLVVEVPVGHSGLWSVAVAGNGEARAHDVFMVTRRPAITVLDPPAGVVGERVTIHGENFGIDRALVQVRLQDVECSVESVTREAVVVTVPQGLQPGPAQFTVIVRLQGTGRAPMQFQVLVPTRITSVDPPAAPPGAHVVLRGEGFESDPRRLHVRLGGSVVRPVTATTTQIEFVVPPRAQSGEVEVSAEGRQTAHSAFTVQVPPVVTAVAPASAPAGAAVTVRGRNFGTDPAAVSVSVGETAATVTAARGNSVSFTMPAGASGVVTVRVNGQGEARSRASVRAR